MVLIASVRIRAQHTTERLLFADENGVDVLGERFSRDEVTNVTQTILDKVGQRLLHTQNHPLAQIKDRIAKHFEKVDKQSSLRMRGGFIPPDK